MSRFHADSDSIALEEVVIDVNYSLRHWWTHGDSELAELEQMFRDDGVGEELAFLRVWLEELLTEWPLARLDALAPRIRRSTRKDPRPMAATHTSRRWSLASKSYE